MTDLAARKGRLVHYAAEPLTGGVQSRDQLAEGAMKPQGFWVSVEGNGDGWFDWCTDEQFRLEHLTVPHEVTLAADAKVLWIDSAEGIDELTSTFDRPIVEGHCGYRIDWAAVAGLCQGVIIAPYIWSRRLTLHTHWYYGWDCASGCIWDADAIAAVVAIRSTVPPEWAE